MFKRTGGFIFLYILSFGFFSMLFHLPAFADLQKIEPSSSVQKIKPKTSTFPTPTIYYAPKKIATPIVTNFILENNTTALKVKSASESKISTSPRFKAIEPTEPTLEPTSAPTNTPSPTTTQTPTPTSSGATQAQTINSGMSADRLFEMSNAHRQSLGLSVLQKDDKTCALAQERAGEIQAELSNGTLHSGMYNRNLPYWNTENAIAMGPEEAAFAWWLSDYIHRKAIENPSYTTSCTACSGVYCVQEFTSYQPK